jgi:hypothetical protein
VALALGWIGLFLFALAIPLTIFGAHFFGGFGFREGPQPTPDQLEAAVSHQFWWSVWHRLVPLFVISIGLIVYGRKVKRAIHDCAAA